MGDGVAAAFKKPRSIIISKPLEFAFELDPVKVVNRTTKQDAISRTLNQLLVGVDISNFGKWRRSNGNGTFYYDTSGWQLVKVFEEQRKNNPILQNEKYHMRLKMGLGPYHIFIPEASCDVREF